MTIFGIIFAIIIFSVVIALHELGHFVAAKLSNVQVNEFALFMGPAIFKKQKGETLYSIRCIPIGGYCAMEGEDEDTDNPRSFQKAAWWKRLIILVSGSAMNLLTGFLLLALFFSFSEVYHQPVIASMEENCAIIREDGLQLGDRFVEIDDYNVYTVNDAKLLLSFAGETADVVVERNGETLYFDDYVLEMRVFDGETEPRYGIDFGYQEADFGGLIPYTWDNTRSVVQSVWLSLKMLVTGQAGLKDITGPVGIVQMMSDTAAESGGIGYAMLNMCYFGGFIAINLGIMNMLPIPALDGGRSVGLLLTTLIEKITKKKLNPKIEGYIHAAGMILLLLLMAVIMFKDIFVIFKG